MCRIALPIFTPVWQLCGDEGEQRKGGLVPSPLPTPSYSSWLFVRTKLPAASRQSSAIRRALSRVNHLAVSAVLFPFPRVIRLLSLKLDWSDLRCLQVR